MGWCTFMQTIESSFQALVGGISRLDGVCAIGKTGGAALPQAGDGDVDLFVFCSRIPAQAERETVYAALGGCFVAGYGETEDPHWGLIDALLLGGQEVFPMFFPMDAFASSVSSILLGERTQREANYFYPTGRCASILGMHTFFDPEGCIAKWKQNCGTYPDSLRRALLTAHLPTIDDEEDFLRAIRRGDVLFFHATLDLALDRFLQALFALNRVYFPSRKRSIEFVQRFERKPERCEERLLRAAALGADSHSLAEAYRGWKELCAELTRLAEHDLD